MRNTKPAARIYGDYATTSNGGGQNRTRSRRIPETLPLAAKASGDLVWTFVLVTTPSEEEEGGKGSILVKRISLP